MINQLVENKWKIYRDLRKLLIKVLFFSALFIFSADTIYRSYYGITYQTRQNCVLYAGFPRWLFLVYEYIIELLLVVIVGVLAASYVEKYFMKIKKLMPNNCISAFIYASVLPVCSCSVIPLLKSLVNNSRLRIVFTFIVAAPLLNPYIIALSVSTIGIEYLLIRIAASLVLAISSGFILEYFYNIFKEKEIGIESGCIIKEGCSLLRSDVLEDAFATLKKLLPFILIAGIVSILVEVFWHSDLFAQISIENPILKSAVVVLVGMPVYLCNGADVLFIKPFLNFGSVTTGTAIAFSLTSTSICVTSAIVLVKYIGKKLTIILAVWIILASFLISQIIDLLM